jgi:excisionase family DNA binding protein
MGGILRTRRYPRHVAESNRDEGDPRLRELFERFDGRLVSPGGAAALLGISRSTIRTLEKRGRLRVYRSAEDAGGRMRKEGPKWVYIPLEDVEAYAEHVGRPFPRTRGDGPVG